MGKVDYRELKDVAAALNDSGVLDENIKIGGVKKDDLLASFLEAVESVDDEFQDELPDEVIDFYNAENPSEEEEEEEEEEPGEDEEEEEEDGEEGPDEGEDEEDEEEPPKKVKKKVSSSKKVKVKAKSKVKGKALPQGGKKKLAGKEVDVNDRNHQIGSMRATLDSLFDKESTVTSIRKVMSKKHDCDEDKTLRKIKGHIRHLRDKHEMEISLVEGKGGGQVKID